MSEIETNQSCAQRTSSSPLSAVDIHHPLFILPSDTPGAKLVSYVLEGTHNYGAWKQSMIVALEAKNKIMFVDGSFKPLDESDPLWPL